MTWSATLGPAMNAQTNCHPRNLGCFDTLQIATLQFDLPLVQSRVIAILMVQRGMSGEEGSTMTEEQTNAQAGASALIASDRVEGTAVYGPDNHRVGRIERLMIDKVGGKVAY